MELFCLFIGYPTAYPAAAPAYNPSLYPTNSPSYAPGKEKVKTAVSFSSCIQLMVGNLYRHMAAEFKQTSEQKFLGLYGSSVGFMAAPAEEYLDYASTLLMKQAWPQNSSSCGTEGTFHLPVDTGTENRTYQASSAAFRYTAGTPYKVPPTQSNTAPPPYSPSPNPYQTAMYPIRSAYPQQNLYAQVSRPVGCDSTKQSCDPGTLLTAPQHTAIGAHPVSMPAYRAQGTPAYSYVPPHW
eukprot:bmy_03685T0